ncbi:Pre-rRNA-processing protein TSR2-domain-containing protein [Gloeopeniophorella convolvens]|nr:Pre-rRNA-processing protein TSR2-domain-containing protein [Gloeopeniophorella convolvens]
MASEASTSASTAPDTTLVLFARGVIARLELWPALRVAVEQGWGGPASREKQRWLAGVLVDAFEAAPAPDAGYVAEMLAQVLEDEFDAAVEDGSVEAVAADVVALWGAGEGAVREWERRAEGARGKVVQVHEVAGDDEEWEDEEEEEEESGDESGDGEEEVLNSSSGRLGRPSLSPSLTRTDSRSCRRVDGDAGRVQAFVLLGHYCCIFSHSKISP